MKCYISNFRSDKEIYNDIKLLIPDATMRRRMSNVLKRSVATAVECMNGIDNIALLDAIITSSSLGLLADSEKFLKNVVDNEEVLINPTPFIQSTFNTVGAQIALFLCLCAKCTQIIRRNAILRKFRNHGFNLRDIADFFHIGSNDRQLFLTVSSYLAKDQVFTGIIKLWQTFQSQLLKYPVA